MNARQKAKHYKKLYESTRYDSERMLPKITPVLPKHYKAQHMLREEDASCFYSQGFGKILEESEIDNLLSQIRPLIKQNMKVKREGAYIYTVDIWLER